MDPEAQKTAEIAARQPSFGDADDERLAGEPPSLGVSGSSSGADTVLLGARHDLRLASGAATTAACTCLAVALGSPSDPRFDWSSGAPLTDPEIQLVIALGSSGVPCGSAPNKGLGASYWGYRWSDDDVIVLVEAAKPGRPITTGAVIPKPLGGGKVYVEPTSSKTPYGRPLSGGGNRCLIGNPGAPRARGRTADEAPETTSPSDAPRVDAPPADDTPEIVNPEQ